ncbi:MAG: hypothetical protein A4E52_02137 [Pelotomaculum sp. PtaB.Bin013]|uniref:Uncharacterized protein n=1 Tax=Pelotomaculum isophthalicicum JI TaxID=947010 RepID=A0A9X4JV38_9FIRM|nr:hypothetical protein [Pelotomaculum isophthalicicum]MDF9407601.1 hypothetical protein [Pelotomaculum isophthalicicum JI]OPX81915.1 MAG: hypothetical protein A4E52_02137 [Pelotomaculum sp. PtaB.Bin013]
MSLSQDLAAVGEDLVSTLKARLELLEAMQAEVQQMLEKYHQERLEMSAKLKEILAEDRLNRVEEVNKLVDSYCDDRTEAQKIWKETLAVMEKLRTHKVNKVKEKVKPKRNKFEE